MEKTAISLEELWSEFRERNPKTRIREAARILGVSEAALLDATPGGAVVRLKPEFKALIKEVGSLGKVMALTRNDYCVHERKGVYEDISTGNHVGLVLGPDIDLRLFLDRWKYGFAVNEAKRRSLQFFDGSGTAVHKIYLVPESNVRAYEDLVDRYRTTEPGTPLPAEALGGAGLSGGTETGRGSLSGEDLDRFRAAWLDLQDTHAFFGLLRKFGLNREKALQNAPDGYALKINREKLTGLFERISSDGLPVMVFTGSPACVQIHSGRVQRLVRTGPWFNVLDPDFNLHLKEDGIQSVWVVKKPTKDGIVTGVEVFDKKGELIMQLFGKRKPGIPEDEQWRGLVGEILKS